MIDTISIKNRILEMAISGKFSIQDSENETAINYVQKLSKSLNGTELIDLPETEIKPFSIPANWCWCRLSDIGTTNIGLTYHPEDVVSEGIPVMRSSNIVNNRMDYSDLLSVNCEVREKQYLNKGDILICARNGSKALVGKCAIYDGEIGQTAFGAFMAAFRSECNEYLYLFFQTKAFRRYFENDNNKQINQVTQKILTDAIVPIPPLAEQRRIVEKVNAVFEVLDTIDELQSTYSSDLEVLKSKIIDAGIQGKLTEQLPEDGNAEDLYAAIQEEKEKLIREKKIKKSKALPEITEEEIPFEIPDNWKWVHIGEIFNHNTGKALKNSNTDGEPFEYITTSNLYWDRFDLDSLRTMHYKETELEKCTATKGDLLVCEGGDIGRAAIWNYDFDIKLQNHIHKLRPICRCINVRFYFYIFWNYKMSGRINGKGIGLQGISTNTLHALQVPLPPIDEQNRIVKLIDSLLRVFY